MSKKRERIDHRLESYAMQCERCAVCYWPKYVKGWRREMNLHHIVHRRGLDYNDVRNILMVCQRCHDLYHVGGDKQRPLTLGMILQCKEEEDGECDMRFLASLLHRQSLREGPCSLPDWILSEREENYAKTKWAAKGREYK